MLRIRYLYAEPLQPKGPAAPSRLRTGPSQAEFISRHLERVGQELSQFGIRRELLASSTRLAEGCCRAEG